MVGTQQYIQPQQQAVVGTQIGDMLTSIMPLIMMMMVMTTLASHPSLRAPRMDSDSVGEAS